MTAREKHRAAALVPRRLRALGASIEVSLLREDSGLDTVFQEEKEKAAAQCRGPFNAGSEAFSGRFRSRTRRRSPFRPGTRQH